MYLLNEMEKKEKEKQMRDANIHIRAIVFVKLRLIFIPNVVKKLYA